MVTFAYIAYILERWQRFKRTGLLCSPNSQLRILFLRNIDRVHYDVVISVTKADT